MYALSEKAMLVRLSIGQWSARKLDKKVTAEVNNAHGAAADAGRYNKALVAKEALAKVKAIAGNARTFHYGNTLPWQDDGARILPADHFLKYSAKIRELESEFTAAVGEFLDQYPNFVAAARGRLNGMFDESDYPQAADVRHKFTFGVSVDPLPAAEDFRVALSDDETARIRQNISARLESSLAAAMRDLWDRLYTAVSSIAGRLSETRTDKTGNPVAPIFRDSLIGNVQELCAILPALNVADDPNLEAMRQRVETALAGRKPDKLRESAAERASAARDAQAIAADMSAFMAPQP
jgi:hypothetical protein